MAKHAREALAARAKGDATFAEAADEAGDGCYGNGDEDGDQ